jgi:hypothetical protein
MISVASLAIRPAIPNITLGNHALCFLQCRAPASAVNADFHETSRLQYTKQRSKTGHGMIHVMKHSHRFNRVEFLMFIQVEDVSM